MSVAEGRPAFVLVAWSDPKVEPAFLKKVRAAKPVLEAWRAAAAAERHSGHGRMTTHCAGIP
jgi:hypothetical protein